MFNSNLFLVTSSNFVLISYFSLISYVFMSFLILLFVNQNNYNNNYSNLVFSLDSMKINLSVLFVLVLCIIFFVGNYNTSIFFNHLTFNNNLLYLHNFILVFSLFYFFMYYSNLFGINMTLLDDLTSNISTLLLIVFIFTVNNLFSFVFTIEFLSVVVVYSLSLSNNNVYSNDFNVSFSSKINYVYNYNYYYFINSVIILFWVTFVSSVLLFLSLYCYFNSYMTLNLYLHNYNLSSNAVMVVFFLTIFTNLGVTPLFFWNPVFFKGLTFNFLMYYLTYYYFFLLLFLLYFLFNFMVVFVLTANSLLMVVLLSSFIYLLVGIFDITGVNYFFAFSSILNTLLVFFLINVYSIL